LIANWNNHIQLKKKIYISMTLSLFGKGRPPALNRVIDSMLTKQKILKLVSQKGNIPAQVAG